MMMIRTTTSIGIVLVVSALALASRSEAADQPAPGLRPVPAASVAWGTSSQGGLSYILGAASASVLEKHVRNVRFTALVSSGSAENARRIQAGEFQCGQMTADTAHFAYHGGREFPQSLGKLRFVANLWISPENVIVPRESPIKSLADLRGRRITSTPGWGASIFARSILEAAGLKKGEYDMVVLSGADGATSFRDGRVDAAMWAFGVPTATLTEIALSRDIRFIPTDNKTAQIIRERYPYWFVSRIPGGAYRGVNEDVPTVANGNVLLCSTDLPDALVYNMTKVMFLRANEIKQSVPAAEALGVPAMAAWPAIATHPGAEQFYREAGLIK